MFRRRGKDTPGTFDTLRLLEVVRPDFRRAIVYGLIALVALVVGYEVGGTGAASLRNRLIAYGCALLVAIFGVIASRSAAREVHRVALDRAGDVAATPLRLVVLLGGYLIAVFSVCDLVGLELRQLLVGGAITGIILGLAAQPVLGNLFAGLVLLFARPYVPGQRVRVMSGALNGPHAGVIVAAGLLYTVLDTDDGPLNIPNSQLLASAVGPFDGELPAKTGPAPDDGDPSDQAGDGAAATAIALAEAATQVGHGSADDGSSRRHAD